MQTAESSTVCQDWAAQLKPLGPVHVSYTGHHYIAFVQLTLLNSSLHAHTRVVLLCHCLRSSQRAQPDLVTIMPAAYAETKCD